MLDDLFFSFCTAADPHQEILTDRRSRYKVKGALRIPSELFSRKFVGYIQLLITLSRVCLVDDVTAVVRVLCEAGTHI